MNELNDNEFEVLCEQILRRGGLDKKTIDRLRNVFLYEPSEVLMMGINGSTATILKHTNRNAIYRCCIQNVLDGHKLTVAQVSKFGGHGSKRFYYKAVKNFFKTRPDLVEKAKREAEKRLLERKNKKVEQNV